MIRVGLYDENGKRTEIREFHDFDTDYWYLNHECQKNNIEIRICCNSTPPETIETENNHARQA